MSQLTENKDKLLLTDCYDLFVRRFIEGDFSIGEFHEPFYGLVIGNFSYRRTKEGRDFWRERFSEDECGKYYGDEWDDAPDTESLVPHISNLIIQKYITKLQSL